MTYTEFAANQAALPADVLYLTDKVPAFEGYGTHQQLLNHFDHIGRLAGDMGIALDMQTLGSQQAPNGDRFPLVQTSMKLHRSDGMTVYLKGGVHGNELVYRPAQRALSTLALRYPERFANLGIDELVFFDADPATADMNDWEDKERNLYNLLKYQRRAKAQADWDYPLNHPHIFHESTVPGCLGSQHIIKTKRPRLLVPQHNADIGSWFAYVAGEPAEMPEDISQFMLWLYGGFPPQRADMPHPTPLAEGVFVGPPLGRKLYG